MIPRTSRRYESSRDRRSSGQRLRRFARFVALLFLVYLFVHTFLVQTVRQDSTTMGPTLDRGDRLIASPLAYGARIRAFGWILPGFSEPRRGDLVSLRPGFMEETAAIRRLANPIVRFTTVERARLDVGDDWRSAVQIKRVIGLPGDTVRMERFVIFVRAEGEESFVSEFEIAARPYETSTVGLPEGWHGDDPFGHAMEEFTLGPDQYFVVGDNRTLSIDSRHWGPIGAQGIHNRVIFRYWPLSQIGSP